MDIDKNDRRYIELSYVALVYLPRLDFSLLPIERLVFFRLLMSYGFKRIAYRGIQDVAKKIDIHHSQLKKSFDILIEKGVLEGHKGGELRIAKGILQQALWVNQSMSKNLKSASILFRSTPRLDFIFEVIKLLFDVKVSHKQKKVKKLLKINFKQWLVLLNLVFLSDKYGVIFNAGMHELTYRTGMSRHALMRAINGLLEFGIIRSKLSGSLNNNYLKSVSAIYFLNLSHPIWGEYRIYGNYYILRLPEHEVVLQQVISIFVEYDSENIKNEVDMCGYENKILEFRKDVKTLNYGFYPNNAESIILSCYDIAKIWNNEFDKEFQLLTFSSEGNEIDFNSIDINIKRLDFLFGYLAALTPNKNSLIESISLNISTGEISSKIKKYFKDVVISKELISKSRSSEANLSELLKGQNDLKTKILSVITQCVLRSEIFHVMDMIYSDGEKRILFDLGTLASSRIDLHDKIYFSPTKGFGLDRFYLLEFEKISDQSNVYKRIESKLGLELEEQKKYGLVHGLCRSLDEF